MQKFKLQSVVLSVSLLLSGMVFAQGENPFVGTWDIDLRASNFGNAEPPVSMSRTYADLGNGQYMYLVAQVTSAGDITGSSATYTYSGERYPIANMAGGAQATISYQRLNDRAVEYRVWVNDTLTQIGAKTISPDGRVLQIAVQFPASQGQLENQILVFDHRR